MELGLYYESSLAVDRPVDIDSQQLTAASGQPGTDGAPKDFIYC